MVVNGGRTKERKKERERQKKKTKGLQNGSGHRQRAGAKMAAESGV